MRKNLILVLIFLFVFAIYCQTNVNCEEISEVETINIHTKTPEVSQEDEMFAPIDLDLTDYTDMNKHNKKFIMRVEKEEKPVVVKSKNQIWDDSKIFRYNFYSDQRNQRTLPSYGSLGSSITKQLDENTTIMVGQDGLDSINGDTVNFAYSNWSMYSSGGRIESKTEHFNYAVAASTETDTLNNQIAALVSTKPRRLLNSKGTFSVGTGVFTNLMNEANKNTAGVFSQYHNGKFSLGAQISQSSYTKNYGASTNVIHILPKYDVNNHLSLKSKIVKDLNIDELQGEVGISLKPLKNTDVWSLDISAANYQSQNVITRQRIKFSTEFRF